MTTAAQGGQQRIPRPDRVIPGEAAAWAGLTPAQRRFTLGDIRAVAAGLPSPVEAREVRIPAGLAAVLVPFVADAGGEAHLILTKRPDTMLSHRGEIAFPGGKVDPALDVDLAATALREAHEEVGLPLAAVEIVAELPSLNTISSSFCLTPFVGVVKGRPVLVPHTREVAGVFEIPVSALLAPGVYHQERWELTDPALVVESGAEGDRVVRAVDFFELPSETVWGATANILARFLERLTATRRPVSSTPSAVE
jgi:8-oxo-dGTP pyrophosphatase MutT (NUDIX family)